MDNILEENLISTNIDTKGICITTKSRIRYEVDMDNDQLKTQNWVFGFLFPAGSIILTPICLLQRLFVCSSSSGNKYAEAKTSEKNKMHPEILLNTTSGQHF